MKTKLSSDIDINEIKSEITKTVSHGVRTTSSASCSASVTI